WHLSASAPTQRGRQHPDLSRVLMSGLNSSGLGRSRVTLPYSPAINDRYPVRGKMCGRYVLTSAPEALRRAFAYPEQPNFPPRHNIAPTQPVPVVLLEHGDRHFRLMRWGLLPSWVKDPKAFSLVINARAE